MASDKCGVAVSKGVPSLRTAGCSSRTYWQRNQRGERALRARLQTSFTPDTELCSTILV